MSASPKEIALQILDTLMAKDIEGMAALMDDNVVFFDPHYPSPTMVGIDTMRANMGWAFGFLKEMHWTVLRAWEGPDSAVLEVDTRHVAPDDSLITPKQVFVIDVKDGKVTRWQSFVPYPPPAPPA